MDGRETQASDSINVYVPRSVSGSTGKLQQPRPTPQRRLLPNLCKFIKSFRVTEDGITVRLARLAGSLVDQIGNTVWRFVILPS